MLELVHPVTGEISTSPPLSLDLAPDLPFDEWCAMGRKLCAGGKVINWWVGDWWRAGHKYGERAKAAAQGIFGREFQTLKNIGVVCGAFETYRRRDLSFSHHAEVAALPTDEADALLDEADAKGWSKQKLRQAVNQRKNVTGELPSPHTGKTEDLYELIRRGLRFGTIYADPPWLYDNQGTRAATGNHYGGMTVAELCELPVQELAADHAHLHLWATNAFLFECPRIFDAWGFEFRSSFTWCKRQMGIGNYWRNSHEFLLTAIRGKAKSFNDHSLMSWMVSDRGDHSAKPEQVRRMLEKASPGPRLEMFARGSVPGWIVWGNEVRLDLLSHDVEEIAA